MPMQCMTFKEGKQVMCLSCSMTTFRDQMQMQTDVGLLVAINGIATVLFLVSHKLRRCAFIDEIFHPTLLRDRKRAIHDIRIFLS